jgi:predicted nucleotidyltransferase
LIALSEKYLTIIQNICKDVFHGVDVEVVLYGSRARGNVRDSSDIDLAVISSKTLSKEIRVFREQLNECAIPYLIEVIEFSDVSDTFKENIKREGIAVWKS